MAPVNKKFIFVKLTLTLTHSEKVLDVYKIYWFIFDHQYSRMLLRRRSRYFLTQTNEIEEKCVHENSAALEVTASEINSR